MAEFLTTIQRLLQRERQLVAAGERADPETTTAILKSAIAQDLLADDTIRAYVVEISELFPHHYSVASTLLDAVLPLVHLRHDKDAVIIFKRIVQFDRAELWYTSGSGFHLLIATKAFTTILAHPALLLEHFDPWGQTAVSLLSKLLFARQKVRRRRHVSGEPALNEHESADAETFHPDYDEYIRNLSFTSPADEGKPHRLVAGVLQAALTSAVTGTNATNFAQLADALIGIRWSTAIVLPISVLLDAMAASAHSQGWHCSEAVRLLSMPAVESPRSLLPWRRLLRSKLPADLPPNAKRTIADVIRSHAGDSLVKVNELADLRTWGVLSKSETHEIEEALASNNYAPPRDPRQPAEAERVSVLSPVESGRVSHWPHPEDRPWLAILLDHRRNDSLSVTELGSSVEQRSAALAVMLTRPEASDDLWKWDLLYVSDGLLTDAKRMALLRTGRDPAREGLRVAEYEETLTKYLPFWKAEAEVSFEGLSRPVPDIHRDRDMSGLSWGAADPIFASLGYLDELLAVEPGVPFDSLRERLAAAISAVWSTWPPYTRAVAFTVLRSYYWQIPALSSKVDEALLEDTDPNILLVCLSFILRGGKNVAQRIRDLLMRLEQLSETAHLADHIGKVIGNAVMRSRGDLQAWQELAALAGLCDEVITTAFLESKFRDDLVDGIIWGAYEHLQDVERLTEKHAEAWLPLATKALEETALPHDRERRFEGRLQAVMSVLELGWTHPLRTHVFDRLAPLLEHILHTANIGDFYWLHYLLGKEVKGETDTTSSRRGPSSQSGARPSVMRAEIAVQLCKASAQHVAEWIAAGESTNDLAYGAVLNGRETADLIRLVYRASREREYLQRFLPQVVDILANAGLTELATELRLELRRD